MAGLAEKVLYSHLTDADSLDEIAREGFFSDEALEVIPTEAGRRLVAWSLDYYFQTGRKIAPSKEAIVETWGDVMEANDITIEDDTEIDSVAWAISELRSRYVQTVVGKWSTAFVDELWTVDPPERVKVLQKASLELNGIAMRARSRKHEMDGLQGVNDAIARFEKRVADGNVTAGLTLGVPEIDNHMFGVHPGEIATFASGSGVGKSWLAGLVLLNEFRQGRKAVLVTLENDVFMSYDRLVCMGARVPYEKWQRGDVTADQLIDVECLKNEMEGSDKHPIISQLPMNERSPTAIVRYAQMHDADSLIIDQLTFMRPEPGSKARQRNEQTAEIMHGLKELVTQEYLVSTMLLHQINREGVKASLSEGRVIKEHMADSSEVERTTDFLWALYQDDEMAKVEQAQLQQLKGRRTPIQHFLINWRPQVGHFSVRQANISIGGKKDKRQ